MAFKCELPAECDGKTFYCEKTSQVKGIRVSQIWQIGQIAGRALDFLFGWLRHWNSWWLVSLLAENGNRSSLGAQLAICDWCSLLGKLTVGGQKIAPLGHLRGRLSLAHAVAQLLPWIIQQSSSTISARRTYFVHISFRQVRELQGLSNRSIEVQKRTASFRGPPHHHQEKTQLGQ